MATEVPESAALPGVDGMWRFFWFTQDLMTMDWRDGRDFVKRSIEAAS